MKEQADSPGPTPAQTKAIAARVADWLPLRLAASCAGVDGGLAYEWYVRGMFGDRICRPFALAVAKAQRTNMKEALGVLVRFFRNGHRRAWHALKKQVRTNPLAAELLKELKCPPLDVLPPKGKEPDRVVIRTTVRKPAKSRRTTPR